MYEETKSSIDWKGLFLKVVIVFLVVLIAFKGYSILKGKDTKNDTITSTQTVADKKNSKTFTENMEKLRTAGETYFEENEDKLPKEEGSTSMVTLNDLIKSGVIKSLSDEDGKICDVESSYVTAKLENGTTKLKANLVCGSSSSYTQVKLGENDKTTTTSSNSNGTSNYTSTTTTTTGGSSNTSSNTCKTSSCTPSVSVTTNTTVSQNINTGSSNTSSNKGSSSSNKTNTTTNKNKYYNTVAYPGGNQKRGCDFKGWYYNGSKYDFSTPVTKDITLTAKYSCDNYYDDDDYYYDNDDYYYYDDEDELVTRTMTTTVYTMGWDVYGTDSITINHTLRLPEDLEDEDVKKVRIKKIQYSGPINTLSRANTYANKHSETFIYNPNGWEATTDNSANNLSTINSSAVTFYYNTGYKTLNNASRYGFDVTWSANRVAKQCTRTFSVNGVDNLCDYGIYYKVTWEYQIYR